METNLKSQYRSVAVRLRTKANAGNCPISAFTLTATGEVAAHEPKMRKQLLGASKA